MAANGIELPHAPRSRTELIVYTLYDFLTIAARSALGHPALVAAQGNPAHNRLPAHEQHPAVDPRAPRQARRTRETPTVHSQVHPRGVTAATLARPATPPRHRNRPVAEPGEILSLPRARQIGIPRYQYTRPILQIQEKAAHLPHRDHEARRPTWIYNGCGCAKLRCMLDRRPANFRNGVSPMLERPTRGDSCPPLK